MWIKPVSTTPLGPGGQCTGNANIIMGRLVDPTSGFRFGFDCHNLMEFWTTQEGGTLALTATKPIDTTRFYHVAVTYPTAKPICILTVI